MTKGACFIVIASRLVGVAIHRFYASRIIVLLLDLGLWITKEASAISSPRNDGVGRC